MERERRVEVTMKRAVILVAGILAGPVFSTAAHASTIFDIAGIGEVCSIDPDGTQHCVGGLAMIGTVTIDVYGAPTSTIATAANGETWVSSSYQFSWTGAVNGSHASSHVAGETAFVDGAEVWNGFNSNPAEFSDRLYTIFDSSGFDALGIGRVNQVSLARSTTGPDAASLTWLTGLIFPETLGLAPDPNASNLLVFADLAVFGPSYLAGSRLGTFSLTSMTPRAAALEPATMTLLGVGLAGLYVRPRRGREAHSGATNV